jgi:phosphatidate cytidylyltransferase
LKERALLRWRIISAAAIITPLVGLFWLDANLGWPGVFLLPVALIAALLASGEVVHMLRQGDLPVQPWVAYVGTFLVVAAAGVPVLWTDYPADCPMGRLGWPAAAMAFAVALAFAGQMRHYEGPGDNITSIALTIWVVAYIGLLLAFVVQLRGLRGNAPGLFALVSMIMVVKFSDIGAYTFGRIFGKRKIAPILSPGKTLAGVLGGIGTGCAISALFFLVLAPYFAGETHQPTAWWGWLLYGVVLVIAGIVGDLSASMIKRETGSKDSSTWLKGMGGIVDIVDSVLVAAPAAYAFWLLELVKF